jgi:hypothetical protein
MSQHSGSSNVGLSNYVQIFIIFMNNDIEFIVDKKMWMRAVDRAVDTNV